MAALELLGGGATQIFLLVLGFFGWVFVGWLVGVLGVFYVLKFFRFCLSALLFGHFQCWIGNLIIFPAFNCCLNHASICLVP